MASQSANSLRIGPVGRHGRAVVRFVWNACTATLRLLWQLATGPMSLPDKHYHFHENGTRCQGPVVRGNATGDSHYDRFDR